MAINDSVSTSTTEFVLRRIQEPMNLFGYDLPPWLVLGGLGLILLIGFFYIAWMYVRDSRTIGPWWATTLGTLRAAVYIILALVFLLPARQTWHDISNHSRVVLLFDASLSVSGTRDDLPPEGKSFKDMPTRQDKVLEFLGSGDIKFIPRLEETNPLTVGRFAGGLDSDFRIIEGGKFVRRHDRAAKKDKEKEDKEKPKEEDEALVPVALNAHHWRNFLTPNEDTKVPEGWLEDAPETKEFLRQVKANQAQVVTGFFNRSAVGESLMEVIKQERNNMLQGIVVFTDGRSTDGSLQNIRDAAVAAREAEIPIFVVAVGEDRPKVSIDIVDVRVPALIRPEDKFRVVVAVNGHDVIPRKDDFEIFLDVTRVSKSKDGKEGKPKTIKLVRLDSKGQITDDPPVPLADKITLGPSFAKNVDSKTGRIPFQPGNPPNAQVEFELDGAILAKAAKKDVGGGKVGIEPDDDSEFRFVARVPRDKREITDVKEHVSDPAEMRVQKKPLRVLLFAPAASREYMFLRTLFAREMDKGRAEVCIYLQTIPGGEKREGLVQDVDPSRMLDSFPTKRTAGKGEKEPFKALSSYDVIVSFDANWFELSDEQKEMVSQWVFKDGGGIVMIGGELNTLEMARPNLQKEIKPILDMLPVVLEDVRKEDETTSEVPRRLVFPQASSDMEFMRLDEELPKAEWKKSWDRFFNEIVDEDGTKSYVAPDASPDRGFFSYFPSKKVKESALVVAAFDAPTAILRSTGQKQPFLATGPWGEGKVVWLASGETWRLRGYKEGYHERFWTKLIADVGAKSLNTLNKRITPIMSRYGVKNKFQTFEARFEDTNGTAVRRDVKTPPRLVVTLPEGVTPQRGDTVQVKEGDFAGKQGQVVKVETVRDPQGNESQKVTVTKLPGSKGDEEFDVKKVDLLVPPIDFKPRLPVKPGEAAATTADLEKKNDGWFKVEFQPRAVGEFRMKVAYEDSADNVYNHKFIVRDSNPELDNVRPDVEALWELAGDATPVLARITDDAVRTKVRAKLKAPLKKEGRKDADGGKLYFDLDSAELIPSCMVTAEKSIRNRGKVEDLWDRSLEVTWDWDSSAGFPLKCNVDIVPGSESWASIVLILVVVLLSTEWLTRKLLRLA